MADRFAYIPLIGLFVMIAWGVSDLAARWRHQKPVLAICTGAALLAFAICTWLQAEYWKNSITLFEHNLSVTADNYLAHYNLGKAYGEIGRFREEFVQYQEAIRVNPRFGKIRPPGKISFYQRNFIWKNDLFLWYWKKKLEKYKMVKQGMMQNVLTGKIRLI